MLDDAVKVDVDVFVASRRYLIKSCSIKLRQSLPQVRVGPAKHSQHGVPVFLCRFRRSREVEFVLRSRWQTINAATDLRLPIRHVGHKFPYGMGIGSCTMGRFPGRDAIENLPDRIAMPSVAVQ